MKKVIEWIKERANRERAAIVGVLGTVAWFVNDGIVDNDWAEWRVLVPLVTGLVIRVFVTSEGVKPGWRNQN